jgi:hypothetical protein
MDTRQVNLNKKLSVEVPKPKLELQTEKGRNHQTFFFCWGGGRSKMDDHKTKLTEFQLNIKKNNVHTLFKSTLEPPWQVAQVPHPSCTSGLSPYCLHTPVI